MPNEVRTATRCSVWLVAMMVLVHGSLAWSGDRSEKRAEDSEVVRTYRMGSSLAQEEDVFKKINISRYGYNVRLKASIAGSTMELVCLVCSQSELLTKARELGAIAAAKHAGKEPATLSVLGLKEGVAVVDGIPMAPSKTEHPLEPGEHEIVLLQDGKEKRTVRNISVGQQLAVDAAAIEVRSQKRDDTKLKVLVGGLGLTAAAIGGVFLWLDDNCATEDCKYLHDLAPAGWTLVSIGIAVEIGLLLWIFLPREKTDSATETEK